MTAVTIDPEDGVLAALAARPAARRTLDGVLVPTDVLLPNGATVLAIVQGGARVTVTDGGAALHQLSDAGLPISARVMAVARGTATRYGVSLERGALRTPPEAIADTWAAVVILANAAKAVAEAAIDAARKVERQTFRDRVREQLDKIFGHTSVHPNTPIPGSSTDRHRFDWLIALPGGVRIALDTPVPDSSSINATVVRHLDVRESHNEAIKQAIAYDDRDAWSASAIQRLQLARVPVVVAAALEPMLRNMAA